MGEAVNNVYFDREACIRTCIEVRSRPSKTIFALNTQFAVAGYTGVAGWSFTEAAAAGGTGTSTDLSIDNIDGQLNWNIVYGLWRSQLGWDSGEPITFFFVSTKPPGIGYYNLSAANRHSTELRGRYQNQVRSPCSAPGSSVSMPRCAGAETCARSAPDSPIVGLSKSFL